ncbi:hypothetical protein GpartN1_g2517.t1 [Galdieria partita]|uniref:AIG1-type G domain-containing protein n=1 Tax=Galdieria partita TaxID=83374 RepID=A0A9C7PVK3_9RHOD|nr:hypothetical protein GpartN1_g2517.t1 [Galdieria partita]
MYVTQYSKGDDSDKLSATVTSVMNMQEASKKENEGNLDGSGSGLTNIEKRRFLDGLENPTRSESDSRKGELREENNADYSVKLASNLFATSSQEGSSLLSPKLLAEYIPTQSTPLIFEDVGLDVEAFESFSQLPTPAALRLAAKAEESSTRSVNILVIGKKGSGKTTLINSLLGQQLGSHTDAFRVGTSSIEQVLVKLQATDTSICFIDTPGFDDIVSSFPSLDNIMDYIRNRPIHAVLYVERLMDSRFTPFSWKLAETLTKKLGSKIWRKVIIVFTCGYVFPPIEYSYEEFVKTRAMSLRHIIRDAIDDQELQLPVAISETSKLCPTNAQGLRLLPDGTAWFPALVDIICRRILYGVPYTYSVTEQASWNQTLTKERWLIIGAAILGGLISRTLFASQNDIASSSQRGESFQGKRKYNSKYNIGTSSDKKSPSWWPFKF